MQKPAQLRIIDPFSVEKTINLGPLFTIGRDAENDLQLFSDMVSRQHLVIACEGDAYCLSDKGSTNGTSVNDQPVTRCVLRHLDRICLGGETGYQIQFIQETAAAAGTPGASGLDTASGSSTAKEDLGQLLRFVEVNQAFKFSMTPEEVLALVVDAAIEMSQADRGFLMLKNNAGELTLRIARNNQRRGLSGSDFPMSQSAVTEAYQHDRNVIISDSLKSGFEASHSMLAQELRTIVCIPLHHFQMSETMGRTLLERREVIGVLYVDSHAFRQALSKTSVTLLESLAFEASKCLESIRLMQEEQEKRQLQREFEMARQVQAALLPTTFKVDEAFDLAVCNVPCRFVGGDFYDLISIGGGRSVLVLGDVCGKGIAAALLASMALGILQAQLTSGLTIPQALATLNRVLLQKADASRFITLFCAQIDRAGHLDWVNAGHNPPMLFRRDGRLETLSPGSMLLGAFEIAEFATARTFLEPAEMLVAFSDGITEAANAAQEMYGETRLEGLLRENRGLKAAQIKDLVIEKIGGFSAGLMQADDITLMILKVAQQGISHSISQQTQEIGT